MANQIEPAKAGILPKIQLLLLHPAREKTPYEFHHVQALLVNVNSE